MSRPEEVRLLEALIPPPDFELVCLVGTTYSLSPAVFLAIISAASFDWTSRGGAIGFDSLTKEEWRALILEKRQACLMFVDHHGPLDTGSGALRPLEKLSLDQVIKKRGRDTQRGGSLHSKLILALYKDSKERLVGRVYVGSKNFSSSQVREFGAVYDIAPASASRRNRAFTESVAAYLDYLKKVEAIRTGDARVRALHQALDILRTTNLCAPDDAGAFHWQGREEGYGKSLAQQLQHVTTRKWSRVFIHSPWTRKRAVEHLSDGMPTVPIHIACLKEPGLSTLKRPNVRYELSYSASGLVQSHQSHAKIYFFCKGDASLLIYGSANLTPDGWGLPVPGCRPNAEILVAATVRASDYASLSKITGRTEDVEPTKLGLTAQEKVLSLLNSIQVTVSFVQEPPQLHYEIVQPESLEGFAESLRITHSLIERSGGQGVDEIRVCEAWPLPTEVRVAWPRTDLYRVSSLVRISCPAQSVETHLIVELDAEFYEGRAKLGVLQYKPHEILESLAQLMDVALPEVPDPPTGGGGANTSQRLAALLDAMRVERYAFKMSRLRSREPTTYRITIERVTKLLGAAKADAALSGVARFNSLIRTIEAIHEELARA